MTYREQIKRTEDFGYRLKDERLDRGLTQAELALKAEVSQRWLSNFETGKSPRAELAKVLSVARALGLVFLLAEEAKPELTPEMKALDDAARRAFGMPPL
ncbi:helix-turn-helix domain-containing protein [Leucobacter sp. cx-169]|uniref:helix-turn-helix domain-containing protein n=1 Tax=Leucobacter sp. cx-169 TaxID=2770549 RepID=UPI00165E632C|nr:helix-turn-helix domain-containing protein [Leucobacter sp. cx-169]MBC9927166.1 helix-turn-helix domain-containing protein [Leucobacter sp. cx-169]